MSDDTIGRVLEERRANHFVFTLIKKAASSAHPPSCNKRTLRAGIRESYTHKQRRRCELLCVDLSDSLGEVVLVDFGKVTYMLDLVKGHSLSESFRTVEAAVDMAMSFWGLYEGPVVNN